MKNISRSGLQPVKVGGHDAVINLIAAILLLIFCGLAQAASRPNILFILTDDQSPFDLKIYNPASTLQTPNIDRLAAEGMVFDNAYIMGS